MTVFPTWRQWWEKLKKLKMEYIESKSKRTSRLTEQIGRSQVGVGGSGEMGAGVQEV